MSLSHSPKIVTDGLVYCFDAANLRSYPKSGTSWTDLKNSKTGSLINGATFDPDNRGSILLDGTDDYIQTNINFNPGVHYEAFTCGVWCRHSNYSNIGYNTCMVSNYGGTPVPFNLNAGGTGANAQKFFMQSRVGGSLVSITSTSNIDDDKWHYCVGTRTTGYTFSIYVDGKLEASTTNNIGNQTTGFGIVFGTLNYYLNQAWYDGRLAKVQIYDKALSEEEILQNYNALKGRFK